MKITVCDICETRLDKGHSVVYCKSEISTTDAKSVDLCQECYERFLKLLIRGLPAETLEDRPLTIKELSDEFDECDYALVGYAVDLQDEKILPVLIDAYFSDIVAVWNADAEDNFLEENYGKTWVFFETRSGAESWLKAGMKRKEGSGK